MGAWWVHDSEGIGSSGESVRRFGCVAGRVEVGCRRVDAALCVGMGYWEWIREDCTGLFFDNGASSVL
jgi:hypothetical protein